MDTDVIAPANAEGTQATVLRWCKRIGDSVRKDEPLLELETDKVTVEIASPASGELMEILKAENEEVQPGQILARVRALSAQNGTAPELKPSPAPPPPEPEAPTSQPLLSPAVRRLLKEHHLSADSIHGSGRDGRVTARDVQRQVQSAAPSTHVPHSAIRRRVAEHMLRSVLEAPHVTTLFEADLTQVLAHRARHLSSAQSQGTRLTLTAYFVAACADALKAHPELNASYKEDAMELHHAINIGVGTALGKQGVIVPVLHHVQDMDLLQIAKRLDEQVAAARAGKLSPADVRGGTFTISNHGVSGSLLAAPIVINQPQVAILGIGKVERRVCVVESEGIEAIGIRSQCYLTLSIDHRAVDAYQANGFLSKVVATLKDWPQH